MKRRSRIVKRLEADEQPSQGKRRRSSHEPNGAVNSHDDDDEHQPHVRRQPWPPEARVTLADVWPEHARRHGR